MNAFQDDSSVVQVPTVPNQVISESNTPSTQPKKVVEQPKETIKIQEVIPEPKKVEVRATSNCDPNYS